MTDKQVCIYFGEAARYTEPDAYASDVALSLEQEPDMALFEQLRTLWHVANDPFRALLRLMGLTQTQCSTRFCIPLRTVQGWALGERSAPPYLRLMMAEATGALNLHRS